MFYRRKLLPLYIAATLASGQAAAVGLGDLSLHSYLGKPLQAEVPLSHMGDLTVDQLKVQVGSEADYGALGVEYTYLHSRLKIEPFQKNGQTYVRISTSEPISEPYLNFVLNLRWPQGQVVREFTVLLDPAPETAVAGRSGQVPIDLGAADDPTAVANGAAVAADEPDAAQPSAAIAEQPSRPARAPTRAKAAPAPQVAEHGAGSYVTQRGDSLWRLAAKLRPSTAVSVEQMMAALLSANPQAFINGDAARLKEAVAIDVAAAGRIALQGGATPVSNTALAGGTLPQPAAPVATQPAPATAPASVQDGLVQENAALKAQVADLSQNVSSLNANLSASTERLHEMEARLDNLLQQFQQQRNGIAALSGQGAEPAAAVAQAGAMINQVNAAELRPEPKAHTPWWVHLLYWSGIGVAAGWAIREHFWPARRLALAGIGGDAARAASTLDRTPFGGAAQPVGRPAARSEPEPWQQPEEDEALTLDLGDILPPLDDQSLPTEIQLDLPRPPEDQVDASISAGVFVAFGRFDEAERLLQDALRQDPARDDLRLQLLDVYLQSDQAERFESLAQVIEAGPASPETLAELAVLRDSYQARG